jgi:hypothetical protein
MESIAQDLHMGISDIRLYTDELYMHVEVKAVGRWFEVIRELKNSSSIDHFVTAKEIRRLYREKKNHDPNAR